MTWTRFKTVGAVLALLAGPGPVAHADIPVGAAEVPLFSTLPDGVISGPRDNVSVLSRGEIYLFSTAYYYHCRPEVNTAVYFGRDDNSARQDILFNLGAVLGTGHGTEVGFIFPWSPGWSNGIGPDLSGTTDSQAFVRYGRPGRGGPWPDLGVEIDLKLNTGSRPGRLDWYGTGFNDVGGRLILAHRLDPLRLFANLGGKVVIGDRLLPDARLRNTVTAAMGLGFRAARGVDFDLGLSFESANKAEIEADFLQAYARARYPVGRRFQLVGLTARGLSPGAPSFTIHLGLGFVPSHRTPPSS